MSARHAAPEQRGDGSRLVAVGAVLFALGAVAVVVAVVPVLLGSDTGPTGAITVASVLLPLGFALALLGLLRGARARRRAARRSSTPT
ncbi:MAG: hypothetical protein JWN17_281 [Frankiales bacterium]|nr:hypothetical protein [Frankiales bacterium]